MQIVRQTVMFPASTGVNSSSKHWYTTFTTSKGMNLMAIPTFSTGRHLRVYMGAEEGTLTSRRRTREGQLSE